MIKDALLHFTTLASPFAPTATGDNVAPNSYDTAPLGLPTGSGGGGATGYNAGSATNAGRDLGIGGEVWFEVLVTTAVTQSGGGGLTFGLVTDSTATITTVTTLVSSGNLAAATLIAGYVYRTQLPASLVYQEYIGMNVNIVTNVLGAGAFEGKLILNVQQADNYLSGFAVQ